MNKQEKQERAVAVMSGMSALGDPGDTLQFISDWAYRYSEPGYTNNDETPLIVLGNWNRDKEAIVQACFVDPEHKKTDPDEMLTAGDALEILGCELKWEDEWGTCSECGGLVRTQSTGYGWIKQYWDADGELLCGECVRTNALDDYIEYLTSNDKAAVTIYGIDLASHDFVLLQDNFERGLHLGQAASPEKIGAYLRKRGITRYVFSLDSAGQFDVDFSVWADKEQLARSGVLDVPRSEANDEMGPGDLAERTLRGKLG